MKYLFQILLKAKYLEGSVFQKLKFLPVFHLELSIDMCFKNPYVSSSIFTAQSVSKNKVPTVIVGIFVYKHG